MNPKLNMIPWIDIETTGFIVEKDSILQIALIITNGDFEEISRHDWIIKHDNLDELKAHADAFVLDMHDKTGLWDRLASKEAKPLSEVDAQLASILQLLRGDSRWGVKIGGNSVAFDKNFLSAQLPLTRKQLSHQVLDMSSVLEFFRATGNRVPLPKHSPSHNAMEDIENCIEQARATLDHMKH
jgi:oligoribonuclease